MVLAVPGSKWHILHAAASKVVTPEAACRLLTLGRYTDRQTNRRCFAIQSWWREAQELDVVRQRCIRGNNGGIAVDAIRVLGLDGHLNPLTDAHLRTEHES